MPYNPCPRSFQTKTWRQLYESYITDLATLKTAANGAALVIFDAEPWGGDNSKPAELGVSLLPGRNYTRMSDEMPETLDAVSDLLQLETHWVRVAGRDRREKSREMHHFGQVHLVKEEQVEEVISDIIERFMRKHHGQSYHIMSPDRPPLILAGFHLGYEFQILSGSCPKLLRYFSSWLDLQDMAREVAGNTTGKPLSPGLHETLIACGFTNNAPKAQRSRSQHNAATDTVRAAAIFAYFMSWHAKGHTLDISVSSRRPNHQRNRRRIPLFPGQKQLWRGSRPNPKELYPYGARVSRIGETIDLDEQGLFDLFATHDPIAVGISNGKRYGWVCLPDVEALQSFLRHIDGSTLSDGHVWRAVSDFDPTILPARSLSELRSRQRLQLEASAEDKRAQRQAKKDAQELVCVTCSDTEASG